MYIFILIIILKVKCFCYGSAIIDTLKQFIGVNCLNDLFIIFSVGARESNTHFRHSVIEWENK